jgi:hypothetical protein
MLKRHFLTVWMKALFQPVVTLLHLHKQYEENFSLTVPSANGNDVGCSSGLRLSH